MEKIKRKHFIHCYGKFSKKENECVNSSYLYAIKNKILKKKLFTF